MLLRKGSQQNGSFKKSSEISINMVVKMKGKRKKIRSQGLTASLSVPSINFWISHYPPQINVCRKRKPLSLKLQND